MEKKRVLIIDSSPIYFREVESLLSHAGYEAHVIHEFHHLVGMASMFMPDAIVLEWTIAKKDNGLLMKQLHQTVALEQTPIILTMDEAEFSSELQRVSETGAADFVQRDRISGEILVRIEMALKSHQFKENLTLCSKTKSRLLAVVSHDLRSPLTSFQCLLQHMNLMEDHELDIARIRRLMLDVEEEFSATIAMANNLLFWAVDQEDGICYEGQDCELVAVLQQLLKVYALQACDKDIRLILSAPEKLVVRLDPNLFSFIARNLLSNAIKFSKRGAKVQLTVAGDDGHIIFSVTDYGPGIEKEKLSALFQRIETTKSVADTYGEKGTGLGLAVSYDFARKLGGKLEVSSQFGKGSTFSLTLPVAKAGKEQQHLSDDRSYSIG